MTTTSILTSTAEADKLILDMGFDPGLIPNRLKQDIPSLEEYLKSLQKMTDRIDNVMDIMYGDEKASCCGKCGCEN